MTDPEIGRRIAPLRRRRGLSQVPPAGLIGRSESWLSQVERGLHRVDSVAVPREPARVLRVEMSEVARGAVPAAPNRPPREADAVVRAVVEAPQSNPARWRGARRIARAGGRDPKILVHNVRARDPHDPAR